MSNRLSKLLNDSALVSRFMAAPSPRWVVLCADLVIVALSCFITYVFSPTAGLDHPGWWFTPFAQGLVVFCAYALMMPVVHTYRYRAPVGV